MEKSVNTFNYESLPADGSQIRLVAILSGEGDEEIECLVANFPFTKDIVDDLKYEALSYVWGDAMVTTTLSLNGQTYQVTTNLEAALRALRLQDKDRLIWIDAICINQTSIQERNQEVPRMGQIYRRARHVIIWMGREIEPEDIPCQNSRLVEFADECEFRRCRSRSRDFGQDGRRWLRAAIAAEVLLPSMVHARLDSAGDHAGKDRDGCLRKAMDRLG